MQLILLRHGEVEGPPCMRGRVDRPLTTVGQRNMERAAKGLTFDRILCSPLQRCHRFAEELATQNDRPLDVEDEWLELDFGEWDGVDLQELSQQHGAALEQFWRDPFGFPPPGGEHPVDFCRRVGTAISLVPTRFTDETVLVVTHGGVIKAALAHLLRLGSEHGNWFTTLQIDYASLTSFTFWPDDKAARPVINFVNRIASS